MKKILLSAILIGSTFAGISQDASNKKSPTLGVSFFLNDFTTAARIENSSISSVLNNKNWAQIRQMAAGLGITYRQGISSHFDMLANFGACFTPYPGRSDEDNFLSELDASVVAKLLTDKFTIVPYLSVGAGVAGYKLSDFHAYIPVGSGLQINLGKGKTFLYLQGQCKMGVSKDAANLITYSVGFAAPLKGE